MKMDRDVFLRKLHAETGITKFCFILGAGASKECGIQSADQLIDEWYETLVERYKIKNPIRDILLKPVDEARNEIVPYLTQNPEMLKAVLQPLNWDTERNLKIDDFIRAKFVTDTDEKYARLFELCYDTVDGRKNVLGSFANKGKIREGHRCLAAVLTKTKNNVAITTNFDCLIENAVSDSEANRRNDCILMKMPSADVKDCGAFINGQNTLVNDFGVEAGKNVLVIKAHGDITTCAQKNTMVELRHLPESFYEKLCSIFSRYTPIFIGYAGADPGFVDMLINYAYSQSGRWRGTEHGCYWLVYGDASRDPSEMISKRAAEYVQAVNGAYVMHDGFEKIMPQIAKSLLTPLHDDEDEEREIVKGNVGQNVSDDRENTNYADEIKTNYRWNALDAF